MTNKFNTWYGLPGSEWCDEFVSWCFNEAGAIKAIGGKFSLTSAHAAWFKAKGKWSTSNPQRGDLVFYAWNGRKGISDIHHVGIVTGTSGADITTIEGNTGNSDVAPRTRSMQFVVGFGTPDIAGLGSTSGSASTASPAGFGSGVFDALLGPLEGLFKHLVDPGFWRRVGLGGLALIIIAVGIAFMNRKRLETATSNVAKDAAIGAII
jgi:hypothetical protein